VVGTNAELLRRSSLQQKKLEDLACPLLEALVLAAKSDVSSINTKTRKNYRNAVDDGKTAAHYLSRAVADKVGGVVRKEKRSVQFVGQRSKVL